MRHQYEKISIERRGFLTYKYIEFKYINFNSIIAQSLVIWIYFCYKRIFCSIITSLHIHKKKTLDISREDKYTQHNIASRTIFLNIYMCAINNHKLLFIDLINNITRAAHIISVQHIVIDLTSHISRPAYNFIVWFHKNVCYDIVFFFCKLNYTNCRTIYLINW